MLKHAIYALLFAVSVSAAGAAFADVPTMRQVEEAAQAGRLSDAHAMMQQVLKEHPNSAKAHFVDAEILAKAGHSAEAREQLSAAEKLEPGLPFARPQAVLELKAKLGETHAAASPAKASPGGSQSEPQSGFPWGLVILGIAAIAVIALIMRAMSRPKAGPAPYGNNMGGNQPANYQPSMAPAGGGYGAPAPGIGSGIVSGLATGAAVGAGIVAGEALVHHFLDGSHPDAAPAQPLASADTTSNNYDMGGNDFGIKDTSSWDDNTSVADSSSWDDSSSSGGDDWS